MADEPDVLISRLSKVRNPHPQGSLHWDAYGSGFNAGFREAIALGEWSRERWVQALNAALGLAEGDGTTEEASTDAAGAQSGLSLDSREQTTVSPREAASLKAKFDKLYRQVKLVEWRPGPPPPGQIRAWLDLLTRFPGLEKRDVRRVHERLGDLGLDESRLLVWWFFSGGTRDGLLNLPAPEAY